MEITKEIKKRTATNWLKYFYAFAITGAIFGTAIYVSSYFSDKKIDEIKKIENKISLDMLSSETQYNLISESSCKDTGATILSGELSGLGDKLSYMEEKLGSDDGEVIDLKKYYSLLQMKDFLLTTKAGEKCKLKPVSILYFYENKGDCADCQREGYVLTDLRQNYPKLKIYSFDYNLDLSALKTLISIYEIKYDLPAIVIDGKVYNGFQSVDDVKKILKETHPEIFATTTTATI